MKVDDGDGVMSVFIINRSAIRKSKGNTQLGNIHPKVPNKKEVERKK